MNWTGWQDLTAGIKEYNYEVWQLTPLLGPKLVEDPAGSPEFSGSDITSGFEVTLPRTGLYLVFSNTFLLSGHKKWLP